MPKLIKQPTTLRQMLRLIDDYLVQDPIEGLALYAVLTALRGPDTHDHLTKVATTAVIRANALPKAAKWCVVGDANVDSKVHSVRRSKLKYSHFVAHAKWAFEALDLKW